MKKYLPVFFIFAILISQVVIAQNKNPKREFRGAWLATVANIDWPTSKTATSGSQISELVAIFDSLKAAGINVVLFQVRTECDALYDSKYEPWSYWLTGHQGKAPDPYYDPLAFAVAEAHARGMQLQAWLNPYRAVKQVGEYDVSPTHVSNLHPNWILDFSKYKMLNPGIPDVTNYIARIVGDIVRRYDVDGIHFDDYFYPYTPKISNQDSLTFKEYGGAFTNVDDWRRNNINKMVEAVYDTINSINPRVEFGISPFGIVENKYTGTNGFESYKILYCDPLTWLKDKTVDYITPQLYWEIGHKAAPYEKLLPWWSTILDGRQLYVGVFSSKMAAKNYKGPKDELEQQIKMNRNTSNVDGTVFFSAKSIVYNYSGLADTLKNRVFKYPALVPTMSWKDNVLPNSPKMFVAEDDSNFINLTWELPEVAKDGEIASGFVLYKFINGQKVDINQSKNIMIVLNGNILSYKDYNVEKGSNYTYVISALDRIQNESINNTQVSVSVK